MVKNKIERKWNKYCDIFGSTLCKMDEIDDLLDKHKLIYWSHTVDIIISPFIIHKHAVF